MIRAIVVTVVMLSAAPAFADSPQSAGRLAHSVDRLASTGRVLYIAAHPDDENTLLLAYLANIRHLEVGYLAMTRGGGGQNLIGGEQGVLLDVIRTEELLSARRMDGARQFFTRMRDFGYSKRADETLALWGHEEALADVVWVIRTFQPDVILTRFTEAPPNHGHHTASAILAREAFTAAADPKRFPEQLKHGVTVWQANRLMNNYPSWSKTPPAKPAISLEVGTYDPRLGLGMGELSGQSRSQHKSQGFGDSEDRGSLIEKFVPIAGTAPSRDILEGIDLGWSRYGAAAQPYARAIAEAQRTLDRDHPERAVAALVKAAQELDKLPADPRVRDARVRLAEALAAAAGVYVRATAAQPFAAPGVKLDVTLEVVTRAAGFTVRKTEVTHGTPITVPATIPANTKQLITMAVTLPAQLQPSLPYWLVQPPLPGRYAVADAALVGAPRQAAPLEATIDVVLGGRVVRLVRPVVHVWTDPVQGERERPFVVVPPATVTPIREAVLSAGKPAALDLRVRAGRDAMTGKIELALPAGWTATPASHAVTLAKAGDETTVRFELRAAAKAVAGEVTPSVRVSDTAWSLRQDVIDYGHIPVQLVLRPARVKLVPLDLRIPAGRVGYVRGSGDSIAGDLAHVGFTVDELDDETLRSGDLSRYAAIVLGIRAYNARPVTRQAHARLGTYVERGGTLVVQYNTLDLDGPIAPLPLELARDRITDETAAPTFLDPRHPIMLRPNKLTTADFDGWVQERGIYFAKKWDPAFKPLLRFTDPGESPLDGALVVAAHGKGRYIYTGLVLFRQLPAGVPGGYRLFANLINGGH